MSITNTISTCLVTFIFAVLAISSAEATPIPIANASFETPVQTPGAFSLGVSNWSVSGTAGVWHPTGAVIGVPPDGNQIGYINGGSLTQTLGVTFQPNTRYTLSIRVGGRTDADYPGTNYSVSLLAGTTRVVSVIPVAPPRGSWTTLTAVYNTSVTVPLGNVGIEIAGGPAFFGYQFDFDLVQLDATPLPAVSGPTIASHPIGVTVNAGSSASFSVSAIGTALTYQWFKDGRSIAGATNSSFTIGSVQPPDAGSYTAVVSNSAGAVTSSAAILGINYARLTNLSVRSTAGSGTQTLIVGFSVSGAGSTQMLVRGIGPTLAAFNVPNVLADPLLRLFNSQSVEIIQNDNWGGTPVLASAFASVGAFALPAGSLDSALFVPLPSGSYSAQVNAASGTGVVLVEGYDVDSSISSSRLTNLSVRSVAGTDANTLIVGFAITGNIPKLILIRGIGPSLAGFGVTGVLGDPQIQLFNASGASINQNDNWGGSPSLVSAFASVAAFPLPSNSFDAALVVTLPPGVYTAQLRGAGTSTGVALVEVYELP